MNAEPQHIKKSAIKFGKWSIDTLSQNGVAPAPPAQGAISKFGRKGCISTGDSNFVEDSTPHKICVGITGSNLV
jgi:hypothetical protein